MRRKTHRERVCVCWVHVWCVCDVYKQLQESKKTKTWSPNHFGHASHIIIFLMDIGWECVPYTAEYVYLSAILIMCLCLCMCIWYSDLVESGKPYGKMCIGIGIGIDHARFCRHVKMRMYHSTTSYTSNIGRLELRDETNKQIIKMGTTAFKSSKFEIVHNVCDRVSVTFQKCFRYHSRRPVFRTP